MYYNGLRHGPGKVAYKNGTWFAGHYKNGYWHGVGKYSRVDSVKFKGDWIYEESIVDAKVKLEGKWHNIVLESGLREDLDELSFDQIRGLI